MTESTLWWLLAGGAVVAELLTGTFYLLLIGVGMAAAALAAHAGAGMAMQLVVAAMAGGGSVAAWYLVKKRRPTDPSIRTERSVILDIGETVHVQAWHPDGTGSVKYRGANWTVIHRPGVAPAPGAHRVSEVVGNRLLVDRID